MKLNSFLPLEIKASLLLAKLHTVKDLNANLLKALKSSKANA